MSFGIQPDFLVLYMDILKSYTDIYQLGVCILFD